MIFDHGFDAVNTVLQAITFCRIFGFGEFLTAITFSSATILFFLAIFESYGTGSLVLGPINSVNEGIILMSVLCNFTAIVGTGFWKQELYEGGILRNEFMGIMLIIFSIVTALQQ